MNEEKKRKLQKIKAVLDKKDSDIYLIEIIEKLEKLTQELKEVKETRIVNLDEIKIPETKIPEFPKIDIPKTEFPKELEVSNLNKIEELIERISQERPKWYKPMPEKIEVANFPEPQFFPDEIEIKEPSWLQKIISAVKIDFDINTAIEKIEKKLEALFQKTIKNVFRVNIVDTEKPIRVVQLGGGGGGGYGIVSVKDSAGAMINPAKEDGNLASIKTNTNKLDVNLSTRLKSGDLNLDAEKDLQVDVKTSGLPTGAATESTLTGIKTGTDKIPASPAQEDGNLANIPGLAIPVHDYISLSHTGTNLTGIVYKTGGSGGTTVATLTLAYDISDNLTSVTKS